MTAAVDELPASYAAVHRYNGAVLQHDVREQIVPMAIQPRDLVLDLVSPVLVGEELCRLR